jgi:polysaccharide export outer membrane protein
MVVAQQQSSIRRVAVMLLSIVPLLAACGLPAAGPTASQLQNNGTPDNFEYKLVYVTDRVAAALHHYSGLRLSDRFKGPRYVASNVVRPGDTIAITLYESGGASLFGGAQQPGMVGAATTGIPPQVIESDGTVLMPYAGRIHAAGHTPSQIADMITEQLKGKTVNPQVIVSLVNNVNNTATVGGDVNQPRLIPLSLRGERLLDVIAAAGGAKFPAYETYVRVVRKGTVGTVLLQTVINDASENIVVRPDDQIFLIHNPRTFAVLGASQKVSQFTFDTEKVTLAEAIARAGGPIDTVGDPSGIFLFRFEPRDIAKEVLGDEYATLDPSQPFVPIMYRVGLTNAEGFFTAQAIEMRDKDIVLVTNAEATQLQKLMAVVRGFTGVAYDLTRSSN